MMWISFTNNFPDIKQKLYFVLVPQQQSQLSTQDVTDEQRRDEVRDNSYYVLLICLLSTGS